jgi:glycosyltransferase involved in cell wall biosynthesis
LIDLIYFGVTNFKWSLGQSLCSKYETDSILYSIEQFVNTESPWLLLWDHILGPPSEKELAVLISEGPDIFHSGLLLGMGELPKSINYVLPNWMLTLNPTTERKSISWKISPRACLLRKNVLKTIKFRKEYKSPEYTFIDFGYRCIINGAVIQNIPDLIPDNFINKQLVIKHDEILFIQSNFSTKWYLWYLFRNLLVGNYGLNQIIRYYFTIKSKKLVDAVYQSNRISDKSLTIDGKSVSVIIPTLNRYKYLINVLQQLNNQSVLPEEVIIIDQTPVKDRLTINKEEFHNLLIKFIFLDKSGQCIARNKGIEIAKGKYLLFCDDDNELSEDFIERHLMNVGHYKKSVSCGVSIEDKFKKINPNDQHEKISDVFSTNNSLVPIEIINEVGLFDLAYDKAIRADKDLGIRMYLNGILLYLNPKIIVFHHRSPTGGLRTYNQRKVTYNKSRSKLLTISIPSTSELYQSSRFFSKEQNREMVWSSILGTFANHGSKIEKSLQIIVSIIYLPFALIRVRKKMIIAKEWLDIFPQIPQYNKPTD